MPFDKRFYQYICMCVNSSEKAMTPHSSTLAWKIPWTEEPSRLQSMGSLRVGHNWATSLSLFTFLALEKEMATHSSVLAWRIPGTGEPGRLLSMGSHRAGHDWRDLAAAVLSPTTSWHFISSLFNPSIRLSIFLKLFYFRLNSTFQFFISMNCLSIFFY